MKKYLQGSYDLHVVEGPPRCRLMIKDTQGWGLGPLCRRRGGEPGDRLRIVFDLKIKQAWAELGQNTSEEEESVELAK